VYLYLFGDRFRCRECHGLNASVTREDARTKTIRRICKLQALLGGEGDLWVIPDRPRYMHSTTYKRLLDLLVQEQWRYLAEARAEIGLG
jgi:hypothetical protein